MASLSTCVNLIFLSYEMSEQHRDTSFGLRVSTYLVENPTSALTYFDRHNLTVEPTIHLPQDMSSQRNNVFGVPLEELMGREGEHGVPRVIKDSLELVRLEGVQSPFACRITPHSDPQVSPLKAFLEYRHLQP